MIKTLISQWIYREISPMNIFSEEIHTLNQPKLTQNVSQTGKFLLTAWLANCDSRNIDTIKSEEFFRLKINE